MTLVRFMMLFGLLVAMPVGAAIAAVAPVDPFERLSAAYAARDAAAAAAAYTDDAVVEYRYAGAAPERHAGRAAITASFAAFFSGLDPSAPVALVFRFEERSPDAARGIYRLEVGDTPYFGHFDVTFAADGRFATDVSSDATAEDFAAAAEAHETR